MAKMKKADVERRIEGLDPERQRRVVCALVGHSVAIEINNGSIWCARCGAWICDFVSWSDVDRCVIVNHENCTGCRIVWDRAPWQKKMCMEPPECLAGPEADDGV